MSTFCLFLGYAPAWSPDYGCYVIFDTELNPVAIFKITSFKGSPC